MPTLTFYETGRALKVAADKWNSLRDAERGELSGAWIPVPDDYFFAVPFLRAGEHTEVDSTCFPGLYERCSKVLAELSEINARHSEFKAVYGY